MQVPFLDLKAQHRTVKSEVLHCWQEILDSAGFVGGSHVAGFEEDFALATGAAHCVAVSNGTDALVLILKALGLMPGGEVIVPVNTFIATSEAVSQAGGKVVFVDVLPDTWNIDPAKVEAAITPRTRGIIPVHLYGQPADMDAVHSIAAGRDIFVVEDSAQAHLAEYRGQCTGTLGAAAGFSFYPGKNLGACGDAGAVTTNDPDLADRVRKLRDHGSVRKYHHEFEGQNARCDALQAAALRVKLRYLPSWNEARRRAAARYIESLIVEPRIVTPAVAEDVLPVWHLFVVLVDRRDEVQAALNERGVSTGLHYPVPLHRQPAYAHLGLGEGSFPVAEACAARLLSLPMFPEITAEQIEYVCDTLTAVVRETAGERPAGVAAGERVSVE